MERTGQLVKQGVALIRSYESTTEYLYTSLDEIKPEMIQQATRDARRAAQQFAEGRQGGLRGCHGAQTSSAAIALEPSSG